MLTDGMMVIFLPLKCSLNGRGQNTASRILNIGSQGYTHPHLYLRSCAKQEVTLFAFVPTDLVRVGLLLKYFRAATYLAVCIITLGALGSFQ